MQSEEEKYYMIDQYLKGKLSQNEVSVLKGSFSANGFRKQTDLHRLANEAVEEQYLLGIRIATKKIIKRNSAMKIGKWAAGACLFVAGIIGHNLYTENIINKKSTPLTNRVIAEKTIIKTIEPSKPTLKNRTSIKPNKIDQTTNFSKPEIQPVTDKEVQRSVLFLKPSLQDLKPEVLTESNPSEISNPATEVSSPLIIAQEKNVPHKEMSLPQIEAKETSELILNPNRDELINFPVEDGFNGELVLMDASGNIVHKQHIRNGSPKEWNGVTETGGTAAPGQYVFLLRSAEGKEIKQGYITVVR